MEMSLRRQADKIDVHRVNNTHKQGLQPFADASLDVKTCLCLLSFLSPPCFLLFFHLPLFFLPPSPFIQRIVQRSVIGIEEERIRKLKQQKATNRLFYISIPPSVDVLLDGSSPPFPGYSFSLRIRNADSLSHLGEKRVLEERKGGKGRN